MTEHRLLRTPEDKTKKKKMGTRPPRTMPRRWMEHHHHQQQHHQQQHHHQHPKSGATPSEAAAAAAADDRSDSTAGKNSTPSSVLINGHPLTRDLSDLSGSYYGTTTAPNNNNNKIPRNVYPHEGGAVAASKQKPWRKARVLSSRRPQHPQPPADCGDSFTFGVRNNNYRQQQVLLIDSDEGDGDIETAVLQQTNSSNSTSCSTSMLYSPALMLAGDGDLSDAAARQHHCRTPLLLLLMDPGRKVYELMQLWVDVSSDTVRDVLHAIQQNLGESRWRLDYDGLFQVRNNHFSQLIHILNISKYDVQPYELWVAKPWSMAAKHTVGYAGELLNHLKQIGLLTYKTLLGTNNNINGSSSSSHNKANSSNSNNKLLPPKPPTDGDAYLVLSPEARSRIYVPEGILKHHHACQFLTFSPPFESQIVDVLSDQVCMDDGSTSQLSESQLGFGLSSVSFEDNGSLAASSVKMEDNNNNNNNNMNGNNSSNNNNNDDAVVILTTSTLSLPGQEATNDGNNHDDDDVGVILDSLTSLQKTLFARAATRPPTPPLTTPTSPKTSPSPPRRQSSPTAAAAAATTATAILYNEHSTPTTDDAKTHTSSDGRYWDDDDEGLSEYDFAPGYCHMQKGSSSTGVYNNKLQQQRQSLLRAIRSLNCVVGCRPKHGRQQQYKQKNNKYPKTPTSTSSAHQQQDASETTLMEFSPGSPQSSPESEAFSWHAWEDTILEGDERSASSSYCNRSIVSESATPLLLERIQTSDS